MKSKNLNIISIVFFLLMNTSYFWESNLDFYAFPFFILMVLTFFVLLFVLLRQLIAATNEKFKNRSRLFSIGLLACVLTLTFLKPSGIINFEKFEGKNILVASREGAANCTTRLKLKKNLTFSQKYICFGMSETTGTLTYKNDTLFFDNIEYGRSTDEFYQFAVIKHIERISNKKVLALFANYSDTMPNFLIISENKLNDLSKASLRR